MHDPIHVTNFFLHTYAHKGIDTRFGFIQGEKDIFGKHSIQTKLIKV